MRVHPTLLISSQFNWKWPSLAVIVVSLVALGFPRQAPTGSARERLAPAVVLKQTVHAGAALSPEQVALELRPASTLPEGVITAPDLAWGRVVLGPLPAGIALSSVFLADQDKAQVTQEQVAHRPNSNSKLWISAEMDNSGKTVEPGARGALVIWKSPDLKAVIAESVSVDKIDGKFVTVQVSPQQQMLLQEARNLGQLRFITEAEQEQSPLVTREASDIFKLREELGYKIEATTENPQQPDRVKSGLARANDSHSKD